MAKQKFRRIEQRTTFTQREQYENALTPSRLKDRARKLSYAQSILPGGEVVNVYFTPVPALAMISLRDPALAPIDVVRKMIDIVAKHVVDPYTALPLMTADEWSAEDEEFLNSVLSAVTGLQFVHEGEETGDGETVEIDLDPEEVKALQALASDPNPLGETVGSDSPTISTANSESEEAVPEQGEEMSTTG